MPRSGWCHQMPHQDDFWGSSLTEPRGPSARALPASSAPPPGESPPPSTACSQAAPLCHGHARARGHLRVPYLGKRSVCYLAESEHHLIFIHLQRTIPCTGKTGRQQEETENKELCSVKQRVKGLCAVFQSWVITHSKANLSITVL